MNQTYPPTVVSTLKDDDLIYISDSDSGLVRVVPAEAIKGFLAFVSDIDVSDGLMTITYSNGNKKEIQL